MYINPLRAITYILLFLILLAVILFAGMNLRIIISIALIMVFLLIFTFIFKTDGPKSLKVAMILLTFIGLPLFMLVYLDIFSVFPMFWSGILVLIVVLTMGLLSIATIIKLDYVELDWGQTDE